MTTATEIPVRKHMNKREAIHKELADLYTCGAELAVSFQKEKETQFHYDYQTWYTKALKAVASLASDRHVEFRSYYEVDPKRKSLGYGDLCDFRDYLKGVAPGSYQHQDFDTRAEVIKCFRNQLTILHAIRERVNSVLANIEGELFAELQDNEVAVCKDN